MSSVRPRLPSSFSVSSSFLDGRFRRTELLGVIVETPAPCFSRHITLEKLPDLLTLHVLLHESGLQAVFEILVGQQENRQCLTTGRRGTTCKKEVKWNLGGWHVSQDNSGVTFVPSPQS